MVTKKITSLQHPLVKHWVELRENRSYREEAQRVLVSGEKMARELRPKVLISLEATSIVAEDHYLVTEAILKKITGLEHPDGFAAEIALPPPQDLTSKKYLVILDQIADPGNLGTLLRTALALQWEGVIVTPGTVDLFNDKALRAAKGATFRLPYARLTTDEIAQLKVHFFTADLEGKALPNAQFKPPMALILSHEGRGPGSWSSTIAQKITIPMGEEVESLNVASSGAILLYAMRSK
ncbi:MAG TPA: RNA methyltransferase [Chlamydiales bacterium]|nr:RNA methyltransferase [Chlamydiales bacterium]